MNATLIQLNIDCFNEPLHFRDAMQLSGCDINIAIFELYIQIQTSITFWAISAAYFSSVSPL